MYFSVNITCSSVTVAVYENVSTSPTACSGYYVYSRNYFMQIRS